MSDLYPVLSIVGTTATGKTAFALAVAKKLAQSAHYTGVDIISADSRQVYKGLEILSGADIPEGFEEEKDITVSAFRFFQNGDTRLFGISCVLPDEDWSVAQFQEYALPIIQQAKDQQRAVLIVGGTGLYHQHLFNPDPMLHIPPNQEFRTLAQNMTVEELQEMLSKLDSKKLQNMNNSDKNNPRRLIRAIEVSQFSPELPDLEKSQQFNQVYIGLTASLETIAAKIAQRVSQRLAHGVLEEVKELTETYGERVCQQVKTTLGFEQLSQLIAAQISQEDAIETWQTAEKQYAQRQLTWWKKQSSVAWYQTDQHQHWLRDALADAERLVSP